jgi:geranylgeranyl diphosphate synthase type 3
MKNPLLPHAPDPLLLESFRYINSMPGKDVRGKMIDCFQLWMNVESTDVLDAIKVRVIATEMNSSFTSLMVVLFVILAR